MKPRYDSQIRLFHIDRWSVQTRLAELINDGIFNTSGAELRVANVGTPPGKIDHQRATHGQVIRPAHGVRRLIEIVSRLRWPASQFKHNSIRHPAP